MSVMPVCDMCGASDVLYKTEIEGSFLKVCKRCSSYGKVMARVKVPVEIPRKEKVEEPIIIQFINPEYSNLIKQGRERLNLKQEEFAKKISEKESLIQKLEGGQIEPSIELAQKLERFLKIELIEEYKDIPTSSQKKDAGEGLTIGDLIKIKK